MQKPINIPFLIITTSTVAGIAIGSYLALPIHQLLMYLCISIVPFGIIWHRSKRPFHKGLWFGILVVPIFIALGITLLKIHDPRNKPDHYLHIKNHDSIEPSGMLLEIRERLKPTAYYEKYVVKLHKLDTNQVQGKVLLKIPKDSIPITIQIGGIYTTLGNIKEIPKSLNPGQFNYANYMEKEYIYHQITLFKKELVFHHINQKSIYFLSSNFRKYINDHLSKYSFTSSQLSIINALLLGQRQDIDQQTFAAFRDAGAIHILAVSGLHVGILLSFFNIFLKPLERFNRIGRSIKLILTITLLWCFAIIAGLSPSVIRAVTMFSFMAIGIHMRSKGSIYNAILISMFILVCFCPLLLFKVGFQLSYIAVIAIVWIQPIMAKYYTPKNFIYKRLWETFTVTMAAQLGLLPLSIFYFHQFPLLFFVSNIIIIPFLGSILGSGIAIIAGSCIGFLPNHIANWYGALLDLMRSLIDWVAKQDTFLLTDITYSWRMLIVSYILLLTIITAITKFSFRKLYHIGFGLALLFIILIYEKHQNSLTNEVIIFHNHKKTKLGVLENHNLTVYSGSSINSASNNYIVKGYALKNHVIDFEERILKNTYQFKDQTIMIVDSSGVYASGWQPDILLLSHSPKIHLEKLIEDLCPKQIVADGSNYRSYLNRWEATCLQNNIPFYRTDKKGAFVLK